VNTQPAISAIIRKYQSDFHAVIPFLPASDRLLALDFTENNKELSQEVVADTTRFSSYIDQQLANAQCRYGIGGYGEHRTIYSRSPAFNGAKPGEESRTFHLGMDIWGKVGTPVSAFMGGRIHSFAFNDNFGDYGATLILLHQLEGVPFYTLYGHISLKDIETITTAQYVVRGQTIAHFGAPAENGNWPPHLHFQIIVELGIKQGDYPGVCKLSEKEKYLYNCPDPDLILKLNRYL
jgi:peptidoglycan LD-endopeptidase LytH